MHPHSQWETGPGSTLQWKYHQTWERLFRTAIRLERIRNRLSCRIGHVLREFSADRKPSLEWRFIIGPRGERCRNENTRTDDIGIPVFAFLLVPVDLIARQAVNPAGVRRDIVKEPGGF